MPYKAYCPPAEGGEAPYHFGSWCKAVESSGIYYSSIRKKEDIKNEAEHLLCRLGGK